MPQGETPIYISSVLPRPSKISSLFASQACRYERIGWIWECVGIVLWSARVWRGNRWRRYENWDLEMKFVDCESYVRDESAMELSAWVWVLSWIVIVLEGRPCVICFRWDLCKDCAWKVVCLLNCWKCCGKFIFQLCFAFYAWFYTTEGCLES